MLNNIVGFYSVLLCNRLHFVDYILKFRLLMEEQVLIAWTCSSQLRFASKLRVHGWIVTIIYILKDRPLKNTHVHFLFYISKNKAPTIDMDMHRR